MCRTDEFRDNEAKVSFLLENHALYSSKGNLSTIQRCDVICKAVETIFWIPLYSCVGDKAKSEGFSLSAHDWRRHEMVFARDGKSFSRISSEGTEPWETEQLNWKSLTNSRTVLNDSAQVAKWPAKRIDSILVMQAPFILSGRLSIWVEMSSMSVNSGCLRDTSLRGYKTKHLYRKRVSLKICNLLLHSLYC